jgi:Xaa-Pro aminopeptidase
VGRQIEGAALVLDEAGAQLYLPPEDPGARLWHGPEPAAADWSRELGLDVRSIDELGSLEGAATLPPQDPAAAAWLSDRLGRSVLAGSGARLEGADLALADALIALRLRHDTAALDQMRQASSVTVSAHVAGMRATRPGRREAEVAAAMQAVISGAGMGLAYEPIVTVQGQVLHARHRHGLLAAGDLLLADVGAETPEGWAADVTRTWPVSGRFSPTQRDLYDAVLFARAAALALVAPGASYRDVHLASQRALLRCLVELGIFRGPAAALEELHASALFYPHGVGHLLGLDVHDMEDLGDRAGYAPGRVRQGDPTTRYLRLDRELVPGMVVTIEPGFYQIPDSLSAVEPSSALGRALDRDRLAAFADVRGIRVEDDVLVTDSGYEILGADLPTSARAIEALMAG